VTSDKQSKEILKHVEYHLAKDHGVIRYKGDRYFNANEDGVSEEAEWTFGLSWLSIIFQKRGDHRKAEYYLEEAKKSATKQGMPELYYSNSTKFNENTPLGWSESLFIVALYELGEKFLRKS
jgi:phosphorylase kinase alpha/beta subunit